MRFVDVDYPELIERKCAIVRQTPQLHRLIDPIAEITPADSSTGIRLKSKSYVAVPCDLCNLQRLENVLQPEIDLTDSSILFIAEVSLTYMDTAAADALINWTARFSHGKPSSLQ